MTVIMKKSGTFAKGYCDHIAILINMIYLFLISSFELMKSTCASSDVIKTDSGDMVLLRVQEEGAD